MREMSTSYGGFGEAELKRLQPRDRMIKCVSRTPTLGNIFLGMRYDATASYLINSILPHTYLGMMQDLPRYEV
jgi:hypothetical protein